jgi:outer membrane receptor protein involved in Fe transport
VRSNAVAPKQGFITEGDISTTNIGLFAQDAWTINNKLTVNVGVRTERERVPTYTTARTFRSSASSSASATSWRRAPASPTTSRATARGRRSVRGASSTTSSSSNCRAARSAATSGSSTTTRSTPQLADLVDAPTARRRARHAAPPTDFRHPSFGSDAIDPDLKPMQQQEMTFGLDHQLNDAMASAHATCTSRSTAPLKTRARSTRTATRSTSSPTRAKA